MSQTQKLIDEDAASKLGDQWSKKFEKRAREILLSLAEVFPVTGLIMGNGTWVLTGGKFPVSDGEETGSWNMSDLLDWSPRDYQTPVGIRKKDIDGLAELEEIVDYLLSDRGRYVSQFEIKL